MMRRALVPLAALILSAAIGLHLSAQQTPPAAPAAPALTLTTTAWPDGTDIPIEYTQANTSGQALGVSPQLSWTNPPAGTRSFVLHMHDPDAALNKTTATQVHWLVWGIPAAATGLPKGVPAGPQLADGTRQVSASGQTYRGPGARAGGPKHHYTLELYALDTTLTIAPGATEQETRTAVMAAMQGHVLGKAVYVGLFRRPN
jgi:Raf kinase inhibitor-like YbhB/YbcL family protein